MTEDVEHGPDMEDSFDERSFNALKSPRTIAFVVAGIIAAIVGLYLLLPKVVGVSDAFSRIGDATWYWMVVALGLELVSFMAYGAVFRAIVASGPDSGVPEDRIGLRESLQIRTAAFAGSTFF